MENDQISKLLESRYFLIRKNSVWYFLGGFLAILIAVYSISYHSIITTIGEGSRRATIDSLKNNIAVTKKMINDMDSIEYKISHPIQLLPVGTVLAWGRKSDVPSGWKICDGKNGRPNLVDRFALGTDVTGNIGEIGGTIEHEFLTSMARDGIGDPHGAKNGGGCCPDVTGMNHQHKIQYFPPFSKIIFIIKVR